MLAHGLLTLILIVLVGWALWKFVGEPLIVDKYAPEDELLVDAESLREKIEALEEKKQELELLSEEVGVTAELKDLTEKIKRLKAELTAMESGENGDSE